MKRKEKLTVATVARAIRGARIERLKMTQEELAKLLGCSGSHLCLMEHGKRRMSVVMMFEFLSVSGLSLEDLLKKPEKEKTDEGIQAVGTEDTGADVSIGGEVGRGDILPGAGGGNIV
jgi:transcriptional regulator with XRE-family HTH domain